MPGDMYLPPDQPTDRKYWALRSDRSRKTTTEEPFSA
jgi:hypothetical protein